ncbi:putative pentatricopeptide repeat-containing protein At1g68930 [Cryptomeria japonica]|uniref:putative pentatricopeptide repeat-containing protein At1g68930 n=1 Tax=Cryptomeria japonica TaxID=3369 RepID=UPI0025AD250F|nr:putative pentatricopeptide repeat-containing protein At1g68930 [Cryptomeria japonica]
MALISGLRRKTMIAFRCCRMNSPRFNHTTPSNDHLHLRVFFGELCLKEALHILLTTHNPPLHSSTYFQLLQTCIAKNAHSGGRLIHSFIIDRGFNFGRGVFFQKKIISMYVKCGSLVDVRKVFDEMTERDCFSWNVIIAAYRRHGFCHEALILYLEMQQTGVQPDQFTFASILPACAKMRALEQGMNIHQSIVESGLLYDVVVVSALIDMYAKCGSIQKAEELFKKMPQRNVVSWTAMIAGYAQNGFLEKAFDAFKQMQLKGTKPDSTTYSSILSACAKLGALKEGMHIHQSLLENGFLSNGVVAGALLEMYAKCGNILKARALFDKIHQRNLVQWNTMIAGYAQNGVLDEALRLFKEMPQQNAVSWTAMITGYAQNGFVREALETFTQMQLAGVQPDFTTFVTILPVCAKMGALEQGMHIHQSIIESGFSSHVVVASSLIDMYAKCGRIRKARELFDKMPQRNIVSWTAMISGYAEHGVLDEALTLFKKSPQQDIISWTAMIAGFAHNGFVEKALETFKQMQFAGVNPDSTTFTSLLSACSKIGVLEQGMDLHQVIIESGFSSDVVVASALIDMYTKCGRIQKARELFNRMPQRNVVSWNTMIAGYAQNGFVESALELFNQMQLGVVKPDFTTLATILPTCAKMGALEQGMKLHKKIIECGFLSDAVVASALIDMYAKCGSIQKARELFDKMSQRDVVSWNAMIAGYAMHGYCNDAFKLFELMKHYGTYPDRVSFVCVLFACCHAGLVDEGCKYFHGMSDSNYILPTMDHYVCMVDLLSRAGYLEEALKFIIKVPIKPAVVGWMCLLAACRSHKNVGLGAFTANVLVELDPKNAAPYILLSDIYSEVGRWGDAQKVRRLMKDREIKKTPGCSWIEINKMVHAFCVGDKSHPQTREIYAKLEKLSWETKAIGYSLDSRHVLNDVEEEENELFLCHHSEKLAIAFGLMNTSPGTTIRVIKNIRVCIDCHTATKFISKIVAREIIVRDANRFHHFKEGQCSCGDYW